MFINYMNDNIDIIEKLFKLIKNHKYDEFKKLLNDNRDMDFNIQDTNGNYLITYAVRFNKIDLVKLLLNYDVYYDVVDKNDNYIVNDAIENGFDDIVKYLVIHSETNIGETLVDTRDNKNNIPLFYAIKSKNYDLTKFLLSRSNPNLQNNNGNNALHEAVISGNIKIVELIINQISNINLQNKVGDTPLHLSINYKYNDISIFLIGYGCDVNTKVKEYDLTPLHYAILYNEKEIMKVLIKNNADPNMQDYRGNTCFMYALKENFGFLLLYENCKIDYDLWNDGGKTLLHLFLEKDKDFDLTKIIGGTNLNLQDEEGNTSLLLLFKTGKYKQYIKLLEKKKMNIFIRNSNNETILDFVKDRKFLIDLLSKSYLHVLRNEKHSWIETFEKICSKNLTLLDNNDKKFLELNMKSSYDEVSNKCKNIITEKITKQINKFQKKKLEDFEKSHPKKYTNNNVVEIAETIKLDVCTFTGSVVDIIFGLIFLLKKHKNVSSPISKNQKQNISLCEYYSNSSFVNSKCGFLSFEIVWKDYQLFMIENFDNNFMNSKTRFIIIPLGIEIKENGHANYLIYDKEINEIERFEPHGGRAPFRFDYKPKLLDDKLEEYFKMLNNITYIRPEKYIPKIGFQIMDTNEFNKDKIGDPLGFCALWSIWFVDYRLSYPSISRKKLVKILFSNIKIKLLSYKNMIRNYSRNIIKLRDDILKKVNMDINDWMNDNYTNNQLDSLMMLMIKEINKYN